MFAFSIFNCGNHRLTHLVSCFATLHCHMLTLFFTALRGFRYIFTTPVGSCYHWSYLMCRSSHAPSPCLSYCSPSPLSHTHSSLSPSLSPPTSFSIPAYHTYLTNSLTTISFFTTFRQYWSNWTVFPFPILPP